MCVEGLRAIPLGCSDCYDKDNVPEAERGGLAEQAVVAGQGAGPARAGRGPGGGRVGRGLGSARLALPIVPYASHSTGLSNGSLLQNNCSPNT